VKYAAEFGLCVDAALGSAKHMDSLLATTTTQI